MKVGDYSMKNGFLVGVKLKELRQRGKLSQEQLALRSGVTSAYIGQIERGEKNPTVVTMEKLCHSLGVSLTEFFDNSRKNSTQENEVFTDIQKKLESFNVSQLEIINSVLTNMMKLTDVGSS